MALNSLHDGFCEVFAAFASVGVDFSQADRTGTAFMGCLRDGGEFSIGIGSKAVDGHDHRHTKRCHVAYVPVEVGFGPQSRGFNILRFKRRFGRPDAATVSKSPAVEFH